MYMPTYLSCRQNFFFSTYETDWSEDQGSEYWYQTILILLSWTRSQQVWVGEEKEAQAAAVSSTVGHVFAFDAISILQL